MTTEPDWLNGWPRIDTADVLLGTGLQCVGCGRLRGVITVAFPDDWMPPGPVPTWPFPENDCPVCILRRAAERSPERAPNPPNDPCRVCGGTGERPKVRLP